MSSKKKKERFDVVDANGTTPVATDSDVLNALIVLSYEHGGYEAIPSKRLIELSKYENTEELSKLEEESFLLRNFVPSFYGEKDISKKILNTIFNLYQKGLVDIDVVSRNRCMVTPNNYGAEMRFRKENYFKEFIKERPDVRIRALGA